MQSEVRCTIRTRRKVLWTRRNQDLDGTAAQQQYSAISRALRRAYWPPNQLEPSVQELRLEDCEIKVQKNK